MKTILLSLTLCISTFAFSQTLSEDFKTVLKYDSVKRFQTLLENADKNACYEVGNSTYTLLALAIKVEANACFNNLISQNVDVEKSCAGKTPLMYAAKYGNLTAAKALIKAGAKPNNKNDKGKTAFDYAIQYQQKELEAYLKSF